MLPLLLPEGSLPSSRWRVALVVSVVALAGQATVWALTPYPLQDVPLSVRGLQNPVGVEAVAHPCVVGLAAAPGTTAPRLIEFRACQSRTRQITARAAPRARSPGLGGVTSA